MIRAQALKIANAARKAMEGGPISAHGLAAEVEHRMTEAGIAWRADAFDNLTATECVDAERLADRIIRAAADAQH